MFLFSELADLLVQYGPTIEKLFCALKCGKVQPSALEKFLEDTETAAARLEIDRENPDA